jgi:hypothetical protein
VLTRARCGARSASPGDGAATRWRPAAVREIAAHRSATAGKPLRADTRFAVPPSPTYRRRDRVLAGQVAAILRQLTGWLGIFYVGYSMLLWPFVIGGVTSASASPGSRCLNLRFAVRPGLCLRPSSSPRRRPVWRLSRCRSPTCRPCTRRSTEGNRGGAAERASGRPGLGPYRNGRGQRSPHLESRAVIAPCHPYPNPDPHGSPGPASAAAGAAADATSTAATTGGRLMAGGGGS